MRTLLRRSFALLKFLLVFTYAFVKVNFVVAYIAIFKNSERIRSQLVDYDSSHLTNWEQFLMGHIITLTPGTIAADVDFKRKILRVHLLDEVDPDQAILAIKQSLERYLLEVTR